MRRTAPLDHARRVEWGATTTWLLCFGLVAYLGLKGGGYDPLVHDQVGIAVWWVVLAAVAVGALPRATARQARLGRARAARRLRRLDRAEPDLDREHRADVRRPRPRRRLPRRLRLRALRARQATAPAAWSARWRPASSSSRPSPCSRASHPACSRRQPDRRFLSQRPGTALLPAALLERAGGAGRDRPAAGAAGRDRRPGVALRAAAAAALPVLALTIFFTLSRGGIGAAAIALAVFVGFSPDRAGEAADAAGRRGWRRGADRRPPTAATPSSTAC